MSSKYNNSNAQYHLGFMSYYGQGCDKDWSNAFQWFQLSSDQNNRLAQYLLGVMFLNGHHVTIDKSKAKVLLALAASQGVYDAEILLRKH